MPIKLFSKQITTEGYGKKNAFDYEVPLQDIEETGSLAGGLRVAGAPITGTSNLMVAPAYVLDSYAYNHERGVMVVTIKRLL